MPNPAPAIRRTRRALQIVFVIVLWGLITHGTFAGSGDEPHYLAIAHSVAFDGDFDMANNYGGNEPLVGGGVLEFESHVRAGIGGVLRPVHDVGLPLLFAPVVRVAVPLTRALTRVIPERVMRRARLTPAVLYRQLISMAMIVVAAILLGLVFDTFTLLGGPHRAVGGTTMAVMLSPPILIFSTLFFTELVSATLCLFVFRRVTLMRIAGAWAWATTGLATGLLFLVHARNIGLVMPLAILAVLAMRGQARRADAIAFATALVAMLGIRTAINHLFWGALLTGPHARLGSGPTIDAALQEMAVRFAGLFVDQEFGLLVYAPVYLLAIVGAVSLWRHRRVLAGQIFAVVGTYVLLIVLPITNVHGWTGGWSPAARFLTPVVPLLGVAVFAGVRAGRTPVVSLLLSAQMIIDIYAWQHPKILWNDGDGRAAFCDRLGDVPCRYLPSLVEPGSAGTNVPRAQ
jgi:hypothetical protein